MTTAYSQTDSEALAYIKQVAILAVINKIVTWTEVDEFEFDVLKNVNGLEGLKPSSHEFIRKVEKFIEQCAERAC
ncbi:MAG: hypothetical protein H7X94_04265 [Vallitaleaceae bacterium]|nr:hypothetical protein [Vallitaleaceae bacterium]